MKKVWLGLVLVIIAIASYFLLKSKIPLPGVFVESQGREHVTDIFDIAYSSNPPTSGSHFPTWAGRGVYDRVLSDGYLIHSLEHGYVVISYNCTKPLAQKQSFFTVFAHEDEPLPEEGSPSASSSPLMHMNFKGNPEKSWFDPVNPPEIEMPLPKEFDSEECKKLVTDLGSFVENQKRIIVVPRINLDTPIALTAWTRIEKLDSFDSSRIKEFIDAFENRGPEKTME